MDTSKKIIKGAVNSRGFTITSPITQWDYGWQFIPEIEDLPPTYRLDFSNEEKHGTALPVYCSTDGAEVPTELIDTGKDVWVWFVRIGDGFGITEYKWRVPNKCKPKTEQDEPTPSQQSSIDQLIVRSNEAVESAEQSASDADQSARESAESARASGESALSASNSALSSGEYASNALGYAESASTSAQASAQSASQSAQIKSDIEGMVDDAQGYAQASERSASASANSASQAQGYAQSASVSANSASGYASQAQASEQTASTKASEASQSATTASTKATESAQSASQALTYKNDAESAKTASQTAQGLAESARDSAISAKNDAESARDEAQNLVDGISGKIEQIDANTADIESLEEDRYKPYAVDSASGSIASFPDGADNIPLKSLVVDINPVQDTSSGDPSPENICPISGWTEVDVEQSGVNVWDEEWELGYLADGQPQPHIASIRSKNFVKCDANAKYYSKFKSTPTLYISVYDKNKNYITRFGGNDAKFTTPVNAMWMKVSCYNYGTTYNHDISINYPSTDHDYHSYTGRSIAFNLGQTVYGGKLDVLSGELVVDDSADVYDGDERVNQILVANGCRVFTLPTVGALSVTNADAEVRVKTDKLKPNSASRVVNQAVVAYQCALISGDRIAVSVPDTIEDVTAFKAWLAQNNLQVVYPLATPITIQLTPNQVNSLLGVNNLWADSGDTEVVYRADTKLYIAKKIAEAISALS